MALNSFNQIGKSVETDGKFHYQYVYKTATPIPGTAGAIVDMNQTSGVPKYNAFAGTQLSFNPLIGGGNNGIYPGNFIDGRTKHVARIQALNANTGANTVSPDTLWLCDYLGFYPLIDGDNLDLQPCDNSATLPRYADGSGVRIALVVQAPMSSTAAMTIVYTNSDGVSGRSVTFNLIIGANIGVCATGSGTVGTVGAATPFFPLAEGDTGVRAIESFQLDGAAGGFICAALVKPLTQLSIYEAGVPVEKVFGIENQYPPEIKEGAYLNFLVQRSGTLAGAIQSEILFINS